MFNRCLGSTPLHTANSYAQKVAVKTNLLYDATTTMNLGLEIGLGKKWSLDLSGNYNPWKFDDETRLRHWGVQPELRYWLCEKFNGSFSGSARTLRQIQCGRNVIFE